jgi:hypothetical protein
LNLHFGNPEPVLATAQGEVAMSASVADHGSLRQWPQCVAFRSNNVEARAPHDRRGIMLVEIAHIHWWCRWSSTGQERTSIVMSAVA